MILLPITLPTGASATYHKVSEINSVYPFEFTRVEVMSYATQDAYNAKSGHTWVHRETIPAIDYSQGILHSIEAWMVATQGSPLYGGSVVDDTLETLEATQKRRISQLSLDCQASIYRGFDCNVLGEPNHYGADVQDQANLGFCVLDSTLPDNPADWTCEFKCTGADGIRQYKTHTAAQIQVVGRAGMASIMASLLKNEQLAATVRVATTIEEVTAVQWGA